jgi:hypothetical protein
MHSSLKMRRPEASTTYGVPQSALVLGLPRRAAAGLLLGAIGSTAAGVTPDDAACAGAALDGGGGVELDAAGRAGSLWGTAALKVRGGLASLVAAGAGGLARGAHSSALRPPAPRATTATRGSQLELRRGVPAAHDTLTAVLPGASGAELGVGVTGLVAA